MYKKESAFTLFEMVIVVVILGILVSMAMPKFAKTIEDAKNKEAIAALKLIRTAERMYYIDYDEYYPHGTGGAENNLNTINRDLNLALESGDWTYSITSSNSATSLSFTATAKRTLSARQRQITIDRDGNLTCSPSGATYCP